MKFKSEVLTQASGSIGGTTYAHNRGGLYRRARSIPTNPNSAQQQAVRSEFAMVSAYWSAVLSEAQRAAWTNYAANSPVTDKLGDPLILTGQQMFVRCNTIVRQAGGTIVLSGPTISGLSMLTPPSATPVDEDSYVAVTFNNSDPWAVDDAGYLLVFASRQVNTSINFLKSPMRLAGVIEGDATTPPTSPANVNSPFGETYSVPGKVFFRYVAVLGDGRLSPVATSSAAPEA